MHFMLRSTVQGVPFLFIIEFCLIFILDNCYSSIIYFSRCSCTRDNDFWELRLLIFNVFLLTFGIAFWSYSNFEENISIFNKNTTILLSYFIIVLKCVIYRNDNPNPNQISSNWIGSFKFDFRLIGLDILDYRF